MTTTSAINTDINNFISAQNPNRGGQVAGGGTVSLDYNALSGSVPAGGNAVTGIAGIAAGAASIALPSGQAGNTVIFDGANASAAAAAGSPDSYAFSVDGTGQVTVVDLNTNQSQTITGADYLLFDGGAETNGVFNQQFLIESGSNAEIAEMYNAAFERLPDYAGLEYYSVPVNSGAMSLHQAAVYFLGSGEFKKLYPTLSAPADNGGPNDQAFINQLYGQILHRTPTAAEVNYYVNALQNIAGTDRAQLLIYFSVSPENQADVSAHNGGWLIDPSSGIYEQSAAPLDPQTVLNSDVARGTVNAADFPNLVSANTQYTYTSPNGGVAVFGGQLTVGVGASISSDAPNITINLTSSVNIANVGGKNDVVNGASGGGSEIWVASNSPAPNANYLVTVNLTGNTNKIGMGLILNSNITVASVINGWNSTDTLAYGQGAESAVPTNLGVIADTSASGVATAAHLTATAGINTNGFIVAQDSAGDTFVWHWHTKTTGIITAANIDGGVELIGVQASSLTSANFH